VLRLRRRLSEELAADSDAELRRAVALAYRAVCQPSWIVELALLANRVVVMEMRPEMSESGAKQCAIQIIA
jgi:hypothetical protein